MSEKPKTTLIVQPSELDNIYRSGKVSPDIRDTFRTSLNKGLSSEGTTIDQYIGTNRRLKIEMKTYLDQYKIQRSLMEAVIYYLKNPSMATVRFADKLGGIFGKNLQLEAKKIANDPQAIRKLFEEMALSIEQSRGKTLELEKQAVTLYNTSLLQRENVDIDITDLLQKISVNNDITVKLEDDFNMIQKSMDKLLKYMEELGIQIKGGRPIFEEVSGVKTDVHLENLETSYDARIDKLINKEERPKEEEFGDKTGTNVDIGKEEKPKEEEEEDIRIKEKRKIDAIKVYHSINNELVKSENLLRDVRNEKLVLHQNYERAKENLVLYERVLINQVNEARNYFAMLFAIYDAEVKYTLPSARLIAHLASLQEVAAQLTQQLYDSRNIFNSLIDNVTAGSLEIQEGIQTLALNPSWDPVRIDQAEVRTMELARRTKEFATEMDRRLIEIEAIYRNPSVQGKLKDAAIRDSGIEDEHLMRLLTEGRSNM